MDETLRIAMVREIMAEFARSTGLEPPHESPRRYLWTDAFAVCNLLELWTKTGETQYKELTLKLVEQVHHTLGRHRGDDSRKGWISGLSEEEGRRHPTRGGLRIGKALRERKPGERYDEVLEWERDGQYFHYLTKWMHALNRVGTITGDSTYNRWAVELAQAAHAGFVYAKPSGNRFMYWKMSTDMSRPLVPSMGHHDPLDGLVTFSQLQASLRAERGRSAGSDLTAETETMAAMCRGKNWATDDALGLGGLIADTYRIAQLMAKGGFDQRGLLVLLTDASLAGLEAFVRQNQLRYPADYRLAFRELGLSIGLHAVGRLKVLIGQNGEAFRGEQNLERKVGALIRYLPLGEMIETFWQDDANRQSGTWSEHQDINMVMLATSLEPGAYLDI